MTDKRPFTLYWSSLDTFEHCPQKFLWSRGWGNIDLGNGPGKPKPIPVKKSEHDAIMGDVIGAVIEFFYNEERWRYPQELKLWLDVAIEKHFNRIMTKRYINWSECTLTRDELYQLVYDGVMGFLKTFKHHKLVGPYAKAEQNYLAQIKTQGKRGGPLQIPIGGRMDILIRREVEPNKGILILDGKNGKEYWQNKGPKTHTDPDQLRWYALCFYLFHNVMPTNLGFIYFRYPFGYTWDKEILKFTEEAEDMSVTENTRAIKRAALAHYQAREPAPGVVWVPHTKEDLQGLAQRAKDARLSMDAEHFEAKPVPDYCRRCEYESVCPARQAQMAENRRTPKPGLLEDLQAAGNPQVFTFGSKGSKSQLVTIKG